MKAISNMFNTILAKGVTIFAQLMVKFQPIWDTYHYLITLGVGFFIGLIIGWFLLGYTVFPIKWINASPAQMREDFRAYYLSDVAEDFQATGDPALAYRRIFGHATDYGQATHWPWLSSEASLNSDIADAIAAADSQAINPGGRHINANALRNLQQALPAIRDLTPDEGTRSGLSPLALAFILLLLVIAASAGVIWFMFLRPREKSGKPGVTTQGKRGRETGAISTDESDVLVGEPPVKSFSTPYMLGDDYFDPSFSIEVGPDFLGECGIGISETLGAGDPKKVTAFEAWLFDKSDIRTITTVLATEYAYNDPDLHAKLEPKGDMALLKPGLEITLETTALRVKVIIKDLEYAQGNLPPNSFIQKATFELRAWVKETQGAPDVEYPEI